MSHLQFSRAILSRDFLTVAQLYFQIELCSILCKTLQLIELYEKWSYLYNFLQRATGQLRHMQLYRATLLHTRVTKLREKIAGVTSV